MTPSMGRKGQATIAVRRAGLLDAALLTALHQACFETAGRALRGQTHRRGAWDEAAMAQFLAGPSTLCLLATTGTSGPHPAGFLIARGAGDEAELLTIGVLPEMRQRGVGRALLDRAMADLKTQGIGTLFLEVDETNSPAMGLYRACGADTVGCRPGYYEDGADAAILRLDLRS